MLQETVTEVMTDTIPSGCLVVNSLEMQAASRGRSSWRTYPSKTLSVIPAVLPCRQILRASGLPLYLAAIPRLMLLLERPHRITSQPAAPLASRVSSQQRNA